jgi:hypothetical protein
VVVTAAVTVVVTLAAVTAHLCRPEAERHSAAAATGAVATGMAAIGAVVTGMAAIGAAVVGAAVIGAATNSSLPVDLVFRSSTGIPITGTIRMVITASLLTVTATTAIKATALTTATKGTTAITKGTATAATKGTTAATEGTATATTKGTATAITGYRKNARYRRDAANKWRLVQKLPLFELARVFVRFNQIASVIVNANDGIV